MKNLISIVFLFFCSFLFKSQKFAETPPMGYMTWNFYGLNIDEIKIKKIADDLVSSGLRDNGYEYIFIDDGWQGGRDNKNNIIPDFKKFPSGMKNLADYVHSKGLKLGIYSDAAPLTCGGFTGSLNFENQDAKTFADWGIDYLKYDYCHAPSDLETAKLRYKTMSDALQKSGRDIVFGICEWGDREPWLWAKESGGQLWRTSADIRDKWKSEIEPKSPKDLHTTGAGILDIVNINANLNKYAETAAWNDGDMLVVGLYGKGQSSSDLGGIGCTDIEYQSQMSLWCLLSSPLMITCDIGNMNEKTKEILMNEEVIAVNQDSLGKQAERVVNEKEWQIFVKTLQNGDVALGILNTSENARSINLDLNKLKLENYKFAKDLWCKRKFRISNKFKIDIKSHETKLYRLYY